MSVSAVLKTIAREITDNSTVILTGLAATGVVTTTILGVKATPKALSVMDKEYLHRFCEDQTHAGYTFEDWKEDLATPLTKREIVKLTWKCYLPTIGMGLLTIGCVIGANSIHMRRNAALASLYSLTESTLKEYQAKVVETIGKNKELKVRDDISGDHIRQHPVGDAEVIFTGKGETLCYDSMSGRYFKTDIEKVRRIQNKLNRDLMSEMFISLNEFYSELGLSNIRLGDDMGWNIDKALIDVSFSAQLTDTDEPCLVLNYEVVPRHNQ